jgi:hypothetical protein
VKNLERAVAIFFVAAIAQGMPGCSQTCLRHTDCYSGEVCLAGTCVVERDATDAQGVGGMTAQPTATTTSEPPPAPTGDASIPPADATPSRDGGRGGDRTHGRRDASLDAH